MMHYYAVYVDGVLNHIGKGTGQGEAISQQEYDALAQRIAQVSAYLDQVLSGALTIEQVAQPYREQVEQIISRMPPQTDQISDAQALAILMGEETV